MRSGLVNFKSRPSWCWIRSSVCSMNVQLCPRMELVWEPSKVRGWGTLANQLTVSWCRGCRIVKRVFPVLERAIQDLFTSHFSTHSAPLQFIAHTEPLWGRAAFAELYLDMVNQPLSFQIIEFWEARMWKHHWRNTLLQSVMLGFSSYNFRVSFYAFYVTWSMPLHASGNST